jgi:hypothetical protein
MSQRGASGMQSHFRCQLTRRRNATFMDARALYDPLVGRVDSAREFGIGEDPAGQIAAATKRD